MTVAEIIAELQKMPQEAEVFVSHDGERGPFEAEDVWVSDDGLRVSIA